MQPKMNEQEGEVTVRELVHKLKAATEKMSRNNGHRILMLHAMSALMQLSQRCDELGAQQPIEKPRIELVTM